MIGDFYGGAPLGFRADATLDHLFVLANDLDAPQALPGSGSVLTLSEPGPVGIFSSSVQSVQQLQALLRAASPIPGASLVGTINDNAVLTSTQNIGQIQTLLASRELPREWESIVARVESRAMPPDDAPQPSRAELREVVSGLDQVLASLRPPGQLTEDQLPNKGNLVPHGLLFGTPVSSPTASPATWSCDGTQRMAKPPAKAMMR